MPSRKRSAAVILQVTPESAESFRQQLAAAREEAGVRARLLHAACADAECSLPGLIRAAGEALEAAARLQGIAALVSRLP